MNKKGFTLIELLAVIVVLAIILVIAVPKVLDTIKSSRRSSMESSAKLIAASAEKEFVVRGMNTSSRGYQTIPCNEVVNISDSEYSRCFVEVSPDGEAYINLKATTNGKFKGMVCVGTIKDMDCRNSGSDSEPIYALGTPQITSITYDINYDKCMEFAEESLKPEDREPYCTDQVAPAGFSLRDDLMHDLSGGDTWLIDEGIVSNVQYEYEQVTDYNSLDSNVFVRWPKGESKYDELTAKSICIKYQGNTSNEINCFEYDNYDYEKQHLADVFGKDKCTGNDVDSLALVEKSLFNRVLGIKTVYAVEEISDQITPIIMEVKNIKATDGLYECSVNEFGKVSCTYDGAGYEIDSMGRVNEMLGFAEEPLPGLIDAPSDPIYEEKK